ncbi:FUSC family protein [Streptosporangium carneum]|uniref:Membrane protein n=1 Tax=Streptosporangium carneum TaxID=47481 RepID=A0A9W6I5U1_9ACTN|nr:FUSC family protein [Streptosporangium carneum]GLK12247.1 membrane protein [Streptosporangium carneum]
MPRLFRRAAGTLADAAPGWLVETVRVAPAAPQWWPMLRMALAVVAPLLAALAAGRIELGLLPSMGAMGTALADRGGAYRARIIRMGAAGLAGALGYLVGAAFRGHGWMTVLVLVAAAVVSALISTTGAAGSTAGLQLLVMTVLGGGIPLPGPPGTNTVMFLIGVAWALALALADWPLHPRAPEEAAVIAAYRTLERLFAGRGADAMAAFDSALRNAYDTVFSARSAAAGTDPERTRLVALLNQASLIRNALISLDLEDRAPPAEEAAAVGEIAAALAGERPPPAPLRREGDSPATRALGSAVEGAVELLSGGDVVADQLPYERLGRRGRIAEIWERVWSGHLTRVYTARLALCMGAAGAVSELGWFERSYWMTLTVALVLKPDFGSVFARAVQRALGTLAGTLIGTVVLVAVPYGPAILVPIAVFAALLPYGMQRNWGLMSAFQAPLVLLLVDLLTHGGPRLAEIRLVDTLAGCLIVLLLGYLPWPASWEAPVGPRFADAVSATANYLGHAFDRGHTGRALLRHRVYDALADLRTVFQRAVTEPSVVSRRVTTWMPAMTALEQVADATAATVARAEHGAPPPSPEAVRAVVASLEDIAADVRAGCPPRRPELAEDEPLERVNSAVRGLRDTVSGRHTC